MNKLFDDWMDFREESISILNTEDKKHNIYFDEHSKNILKYVPNINKKNVKKQLYKLDNEFADYTSYWNKKYYLQGLKDSIQILLYINRD